jgi:hypothetical protein
MSKFPEKIWTLSWDDERYILEYFLKYSREDSSATYDLINGDDFEFIFRGEIIKKDDDNPDEFQKYWEDYPTLLRFRNKLIDSSIFYLKQKIEKLESLKIYE